MEGLYNCIFIFLKNFRITFIKKNITKRSIDEIWAHLIRHDCEFSSLSRMNMEKLKV